MADRSDAHRCRYLLPDSTRCFGTVLNQHADIHLCYEHTLRAIRSMDITSELLDKVAPPADGAALRVGVGHAVDQAPGYGPEIVYYVRRDRLVKIGTSAGIVKRMAALRPVEILAFEPGGRELEALRHKAFRRHRRTGEWFDMAPELMAHIAEVRGCHGAPSLADPKWVGNATAALATDLPDHVMAALPKEIQAAVARLR